jgi:hypothetical protein
MVPLVSPLSSRRGDGSSNIAAGQGSTIVWLTRDERTRYSTRNLPSLTARPRCPRKRSDNEAYTKKLGEADATLAIGDGDKEIIEVVVAKPSGKSHPYRMVDLINEVNKRAGGKFHVTQHNISAINHCYNITKKDEYFHHSGITGAPKQYSDRYVEWIVERATTDPTFLSKSRERYQNERITRTGKPKKK